MMASKIYWLLLVMLLSISTFGLSMCCIMGLSVISCISGVLISTYIGKKLKISSLCGKSFHNNFNCDSSMFQGIPKVVIQMDKPSLFSKSDQRLTGSTAIDGPLKQILSNIIRDFIQSWYQEVSLNEDFIEGFNDICKKIINNFSKSAKEVNWVSFFTQRVVEDFTSHLRLFRHTENTFRRKQKENPDQHSSLETIFFDKESNHSKNICHENVCCSSEHEDEYLQSICDVLLYLLLPPDDFSNKVLKQFLREVLLSAVLKPLLAKFSDPDEINQNIIYLCKDHLITSKALVNVLRRSDNADELVAFVQICKHEYKVQNAKDSGDKDEMKKYLKSISFVEKLTDQRIKKLLFSSKEADDDSAEFYLNPDVVDSPIFEKSKKLISLPFDVIINNNIALHYFTQYLLDINAARYVFFYHNVEGFRATVQMMRVEANLTDEASISETSRALAAQLYDSYLGANATSKINIDENILKKLMSRIKTENITEICFDEVQDKVHECLENEFYLAGFKDSTLYIKLLAELDLLQESNSNSDLDDLSSSRSEEDKLSCDAIAATDEESLNDLLSAEISPTDFDFPEISSGPLSDDDVEVGLLIAEVHSTGVTHHAGKTFAIYAIAVTHFKFDGSEEKWFVVRRYSEFYDFHETVTNKFPALSSFNFPSKKTFNNLTRQLMEKRRHMLNEFMQYVLSPEILSASSGLKVIVYNFLQPNMPEKGKKSFIRSVGSIVSPIKTSVKSVGQFARMVPDTLFELKDGFKKTFFKNNPVDPLTNEDYPMISKDTKADDIPFRIILLLMDEVFNLRNKDLWFRRRIMALLRQIIKTMQGGAINRKIKEYVQGMTSTAQIAEWLKILCQSIWPDGKLADPAVERDYSTKMRTKIVTKMLLLCAIPDELKHIIGYETSFKGAMLIFSMFQHQSLNKRLLLVMLESFLKTLFPHNKIPELLQKLHSRSSSIPSRSPSTDIIENNQQPFEDRPEIRIDDTEVKTTPKDTELTAKSPKQPKRRLSLTCLSQLSFSPSPKQRRRKKSIETSTFYTDLPKDEDQIFLPLSS